MVTRTQSHRELFITPGRDYALSFRERRSSERKYPIVVEFELASGTEVGRGFNELINTDSKACKMTVADLIKDYVHQVTEKSELDPYFNDDLFSEFLSKVSALRGVEPEIAEKLEKMVSNPCEKDATLWIWVASLHRSDLYFQSLCDLLKQDAECIWHEGIVQIFQETKNVQAVPCLEIALNHQLDYDPGEALAIRILEALADIGTPDALRILKGCLTSSSKNIRREARLMLDSL